MGNWSELTGDIFNQVLRSVTCLEDFVRVSAVCKPWRLIALGRETSVIPFAPWLMLAKGSNSNRSIENGNNVRSFFSLSQKQIFNHQLPQAQGRRCFGSPYGWLVTVGLDLNIHLLNPLSKIQISLPPHLSQATVDPFSPKSEEIIKFSTPKFVLASNPSLWNTPSAQLSVVIAIYGAFRNYAYASPGSAAWTRVPWSQPIDDVIFFNGRIYSVNRAGALCACEVNTSPPELIEIAEPPESRLNTDTINSFNRFYLLEISEGLHLVQRVFRSRWAKGIGEYSDRSVVYYDTYGFAVSKFDFDRKKWNELKDLGDHALFLGDNTSFSVLTTIYTELEGNSIYFSDDHESVSIGNYQRVFSNGVCDMGVFDYKKGTVMPFPVHTNATSEFSRPLFFLPSL